MTEMLRKNKKAVCDALIASAKIRNTAKDNNAKYRLECAKESKFDEIDRYEGTIRRMDQVVRDNALRFSQIANTELFKIHEIIKCIAYLVTKKENKQYYAGILYTEKQAIIYLFNSKEDSNNIKKRFSDNTKIYSAEEIKNIINEENNYKILAIISNKKGLISASDIIGKKWEYVRNYLDYLTDERIKQGEIKTLEEDYYTLSENEMETKTYSYCQDMKRTLKK